MNDQLKHYSDKLAYEIDSWDLNVGLEAGENIAVVDARSPEAFQREHIPGAVNIPHRTMSPETTRHLGPYVLFPNIRGLLGQWDRWGTNGERL